MKTLFFKFIAIGLIGTVCSTTFNDFTWQLLVLWIVQFSIAVA